MPAEPRFPQPLHQRGYILRTEGENWNTDTSDTWMDIETIMLSEKSQTQKDSIYMFKNRQNSSLMTGIKTQ